MFLISELECWPAPDFINNIKGQIITPHNFVAFCPKKKLASLILSIKKNTDQNYTEKLLFHLKIGKN